MPDSYAHCHNATEALNKANYTPRYLPAFILGCNGPDIFYYCHRYDTLKKNNIQNIGTLIHNSKTGLFLQNMFGFAQTNAQKDFCLGWLCHYALDSVMHPYINHITTAYGSPFNIEHGHNFFESSLDSLISEKNTGFPAADPDSYLPDISKMYVDQIITLLKKTVDKTYPEEKYERSEYLLCYNDFRRIKKSLYVPGVTRIVAARIMEMSMKLKKDTIFSRIQPSSMKIENTDIWRNNPVGFFCNSTIDDLLELASQLAADHIAVGLKYFDGVYNLQDLLEDIGSKSYMTGLALYD